MSSPLCLVCFLLLSLKMIFYGGVDAQHIFEDPPVYAPRYQPFGPLYNLQSSQPFYTYNVPETVSIDKYVPVVSANTVAMEPALSDAILGNSWSVPGDGILTQYGDIHGGRNQIMTVDAGGGVQTMANGGGILNLGKKLVSTVLNVGGLLGGGGSKKCTKCGNEEGGDVEEDSGSEDKNSSKDGKGKKGKKRKGGFLSGLLR